MESCKNLSADVDAVSLKFEMTVLEKITCFTRGKRKSPISVNAILAFDLS